jgi:hypothetical protein
MGPAGGLSSLWICTGNDYDETACDGDNLLVSLDAPKNRANLNLKIKID